MSDKRDFDVVVLGGGVIGLSCAWRLARRGARVVVLEQYEPGWGATGVAAGMLAPVGELTFGEPELLELTLAAAQMYPEFIDELEEASGEDTGYEQLGALHVALDRDEAAQLRRVHELQRSLDLEAEWLSPRRCREREPGLTPSFRGGVFAPGEAAVDPRALTKALLAALAAEGVEVRTRVAVHGGLFDNECLVGVRALPFASEEMEEIRADAVVLATGAWSGGIGWLPEDARPRVRPVKGQVVELKRPRMAKLLPPVTSHILASERVYLVPRPDGRLIVGATVEEMGFDTTVTAGGIHELLREAYRLLPEVAELAFVGANAGLRPGTPNNLPIVGPGAIDGLVLATGHFRNGILLAPLAAETVADHLAGAPKTDRRSSFPGDMPGKGRTPARDEVAR